jgi:tetratricopeptide (TPR) repeat protein
MFETYFDRGEYQKSLDHYEKAISLLKHGRLWPSLANLFKIALVRAKVMSDDKDVHLESLYDRAARNKMQFCDGMTARLIGEILLNVDDKHISEAEDWIKKAIEADRRNGMIWWHLARDYVLYVDLFKRKGDLIKARENLLKAIETFKECGADGWVKKCEKELELLEI